MDIHLLSNYEEEFYGQYPETKVVILTTSPLELERVQKKNFRSVTDYMLKPLTTFKLQSLVNAANKKIKSE
jgi:hypothetical protein